MKINSPLSVVLGVSIFVGLGVAATYFYDQAPRCSKSTDECIQDKIEYQRKYTIEQDGIFEDNIKKAQDAKLKFDHDQATLIEGLKLQQTQGWGADQMKKGQLQNVPQEVLKQAKNSLIPQAQADSTPTVTTSVQVDEPYVGRYTKVLAAYHSPYKNVPIDRYCNDAGLEQWRCDVLVGIAQQESQMGKDFSCKGQTKASAITLGQTYYFNPSGLTDRAVHYRKGVSGKVPDENGCYLRKFDSWDAFWQWLPKSFLDSNMSYYIGNWSTIKQLSGLWVNGFVNAPSTTWKDTVIGVVNKIKSN